MNALPRLVFALTLVIVAALVYATAAGLPLRIATHFAAGGAANGFMTRDAYLVVMLCLTTLLPLALVVLVGFVPSVAASNIKGPQRDYWLAPERRAATLAWIGNHACWLGVLLALFLFAMHLLTVQANGVYPPRFSEAVFFPVLAAFVVGMAVWVARLYARFRPGRRA